MMKQGHQLLAVTVIYGGALIAKNYSSGNEYLMAFAYFIANIPLAALPFILMCSILPDIDGGVENSKAGKISYLAPIAVVVKFLFSHRGFTHNIFGIATFGAMLYFLSFFKFNILSLAVFTYLFLGSVLIILKKGPIRMILSWLIIIAAPLLLTSQYYHSILFACFVAYVSHMIGDLISTEGWTPLSLFGKKIHLNLPFSFRVGGTFELCIVYPILGFTLLYIAYAGMEFWKLKIITEGHDLIKVYMSLI